jgi:hypothetical protein
MSKYNLGIVKTSILGNLNESTVIKQFVTLLKESNLLKLEFSIIDNIEKIHIPNEDLAIKYIDENVKLLKDAGYTKELFESENKKFLPLIEGIQFANTDKKELYERIHSLLYESLAGKKVTNVNKLHDSFSFVLEHIKNNNKKAIVETIELPALLQDVAINDFIVKSSIHEFNEKYGNLLSEDEMSIFKSIIDNSTETKKSTFIALREDTVTSLKTYLNELTSKDMTGTSVHEQRELGEYIDKTKNTITNIDKLSFNESTYMKDVVDLVSLKNDLSN